MSPSARRWLWFAVRWLGTLGGLAWIAWNVDLRSIGTTLLGVSPWAVLVSMGVTASILLTMAVRWQLLMRAYGAQTVPKLSWLIRLTWVGFFYNTFLPGGVGGDVVRGTASRRAFGESGLTRGLAVVFVDRVLGVVGLLAVAGLAAWLVPLPGVESVPWMAALGLAIAGSSLAGLAVLPFARPRLPAPIRRFVPDLPPLARVGPAVFAALLGPLGHGGVALSGHLILVSMVPEVAFTTSLVVIPLAMATQLLPITVGGTGAREAAFAALYSLVGVSAEPAVATSLALYGTYLALGAVGGVLRVPTAGDEPADGS